jgi:hypothetical protein
MRKVHGLKVEKDINLENMMTQLAMATATASDL